jgi:hypothetical protein
MWCDGAQENLTSLGESAKQLSPVYNRDLVTTFKHELQDIQAFIELLKLVPATTPPQLQRTAVTPALCV